MVRTGFLLNHDAAHQVMHSVPAAFELAQRYADIDVVIICTSEMEAETVAAIADDYPEASWSLEMAEAPRYAYQFDRFTGHALLAKRFAVLWHHLDLFRTFDALVVPDKTSLVLKRWLGRDCPIMINTFHGAGDRSGGYKGVAGFDYHLVPGQKYLSRMVAEGLADKDRCAVVGYMKFDRLRNTPARKFFDNDRPTVLYAPHFDPAFSSWYGDWGREIIDFFANSNDYNLIFAPHVLMYRRRWHISMEGGWPRRTPAVPEQAQYADNIHVDLGSRASIDMTYTQSADIYLGDVSSVVYEFLVIPRPCIFVNRSGVQWHDNDNFRFWHTGEVIESPAELPHALDVCRTQPEKYRSAQQEAISEAFDLTDTPAAVRAADAIAEFLGETSQGVAVIG